MDDMDKTIHRYSSLDAMKADEYRAWQKLLPRERLNAAAELSIGAYLMKESSKNVPAGLQRTKELLSVFNSRRVRYLPSGALLLAPAWVVLNVIMAIDMVILFNKNKAAVTAILRNARSEPS